VSSLIVRARLTLQEQGATVDPPEGPKPVSKSTPQVVSPVRENIEDRDAEVESITGPIGEIEGDAGEHTFSSIKAH
jgi:hypothetical protein